MTKLNIVFVTPEYVTEKYYSGGLANYLHRVSQPLVSQGHQVQIITLSDVDDAEFIHDGIQIYRIKLGAFPRRFNRLTLSRLKGTGRWLNYSFRVYQKLKQLQQKQKIDIIQFPNFRACGLFPILLLSILNVTRISSYRPLWNEQTGVDRNLDCRMTEWLESLQLKLSENIYAPSFTLQKILARQENLTQVKVIRTPFYLETNIHQWDTSIYEERLSHKSYLLFFGRFQLHKGFHILAQALPKILEKYPNFYAVLVGLDLPSSLSPSMKQYAISCCGDYAERVIFLGQTHHTKLYPIINRAKLVVLPSLVDNLPNACLESMALGKPVIGTIGASFDELITDGENGFLVPSDDIEALASKIIAVWQHPDLSSIGEAAKRKIQQLEPENTVKQLLEYYRAIMQKNSKEAL